MADDFYDAMRPFLRECLELIVRWHHDSEGVLRDLGLTPDVIDAEFVIEDQPALPPRPT